MTSLTSYPEARILIVDDERDLLKMMGIFLAELGTEIRSAQDAEAALKLLEQERFDLILCDHYLPGATGMDLLLATREIKPDPPLFIMMTGQGSVELAVQAMKNGAHHFLEKPFDMNQLSQRVRAALDQIHLATENRSLRRAVESHYIFTEIIGVSKILHDVLD
ncbi:response regulator, partial [bacterium]|nr:response regulator [bacterium]